MVAGAVEVDYRGFSIAARRLKAAIPQEVAGPMLKYQAGRVVHQARRFLPPKTQAQGRKAVKRDIGRVVKGTDKGLLKAVEDRYGSQNVSGYITTKKGQSVRLEWDEITRDERRIAKVHQSSRNRRGRVRAQKKGWSRDHWRAPVMAPKPVKNRYVKKVQKRVGRLKGGYNAAAAKLGVKTPNWIAKHGTRRGSIRVDLTGPKMSITITNRAGRYPDHKRVLRDAVASRARAMVSQTKRLLAGKATNLGFAVK